MKLNKVLIANRGEIALRVQRGCDKLGIACVITASEPDAKLYFARAAHELAIIGPAPAKDSYLNIEKLIETALTHGCDSVHPGYGFLSERAEFARAVINAGLNWIGPPPEAIDALGSKTAAREIARQCGVPTTPGAPTGLTDQELAKLAKQVGYPVLIKAVAGGGGRGMRVIENHTQMLELLPRARAEALKNFGSGEVYFEKLIIEPRHVEVQVIADKHGHVLHLGTRDCSTQRRHQKLIEEAPAPDLNPELREGIHNAAVKIAAAVGYQNVGTAEFLVAEDQFYFLEMNTRIQVEHPVTEIITGIDLVEWQLRIARGEELGFTQEKVNFKGHAIEYRIYAEDPAENFSPTRGPLIRFQHPEHEFVRADFGYQEGDEVSLFYDAMLSKLIISGKTRKQAVANSERALKELVIEGPATTIPFHRWLLRFTEFAQMPLDITYVEREFKAEQALRELKASDILDSAHRGTVYGANFVEQLTYTSKRFGHEYRIEVLHESEGTFLFRPLKNQAQGAGISSPEQTTRYADNKFCRRSNGYNAGLSALISEVLEREFPGAVV